MTEVNTELLQELLRRLHQRIDKMEAVNRELRTENNSLRRTLTSHQNDIDNFYELIHRVEDRIERVEACLELRDFSERAQTTYDAGA